MSSPRTLGDDQPQWQVIILREPEKVLRKLPKDLLNRIRKVIDRLAV